MNSRQQAARAAAKGKSAMRPAGRPPMMAGSGQSGHGAGRGPAGALLQGQPTADACGAGCAVTI